MLRPMGVDDWADRLEGTAAMIDYIERRLKRRDLSRDRIEERLWQAVVAREVMTWPALGDRLPPDVAHMFATRGPDFRCGDIDRLIAELDREADINRLIAKLNAPATRKPGGAPPKADWDIIEDAFKYDIKKGEIDPDERGAVTRWLRQILKDLKTPVSPRTLKGRARKLRELWENDTGLRAKGKN
jgi:hypothetical protein